MDKLVCLEKMILIEEKGHFIQKSQVFKAFISFSSHKLDHKNYKDYKNPLK